MVMNTIYNYEYVSKEMFIFIIKTYGPGELGRYCNGLRDGRPGVRFPSGARDSSVPHTVQTGSGGLPTSYTISTGGSFPGSKAAGA
jgi:hypothetical protein